MGRGFTWHRAREGDPGHGPSWSSTRTVEGKTRTRNIPAEAVEDTQTQIAEYRRARTLPRELFEVSTRMREVQLEALEATATCTRPRHRTVHGGERATVQGRNALGRTPVRNGERGEHVADCRRVAVTHASIPCVRNTGVSLSRFRRPS